MSASSRRTITVAALLMLLGTSAAAIAQESGVPPVPVVEVSGGYTYLHDFTSDLPKDITFPAGWYVSSAFNANRWFGIVGEVTGSYKNDFRLDIEDSAFPTDMSMHTFMGGPRFAAKAGRLMPFAQMLAGVAHIRGEASFPIDSGLVVSAKARQTQFAFQPGGGLTVLLSDHVGVRFAGDYRCIVDFGNGGDNSYANEFRFLSGFTFNWGAR